MLKSPTFLPWMSVAVTMLIWTSFLVVTRAAANISLGPVDVGLLRFFTATAVLTPLLLKRGVLPAPAQIKHILTVALLGGFGFVLLLASGMRYAPVADSTIFAPSMLPLYVALLSALMLGERFSRVRIAGFTLILIGAVGVGGWEAIAASGDGTWRGHLYFTVASFVWAVFTIKYRASGLDALGGAALLCFWSGLAFLAMAPFVEVRLFEIPRSTLLFHMVMQGVLAGVASTITYAYALRHIAPSKVAACAALVPPLAALSGWVFLGEPVGVVKALGIAVVAAGVLLASGALDRRVAQAAG